MYNYVKSLRSLFSFALIWTLIISLTLSAPFLGQSGLALAHDTDASIDAMPVAASSNSNSSNSTQLFAATEEQSLSQSQHTLLQLADAIEDGSPQAMHSAMGPLQDPFHEVGQKVLIYPDPDNFNIYDTYELNLPNSRNAIGPQRRLPRLNRNSLQLKTRFVGTDLYIDGIYGADQNGEHGQLIASHVIPFESEVVAISSLDHDPELIMLLTSEGSLYALSRTLLAQAVFSENEIPAFRIWSMSRENTPDAQKMRSTLETLLRAQHEGRVEFHIGFATIGSPWEFFSAEGLASAWFLPDELASSLQANKFSTPSSETYNNSSKKILGQHLAGSIYFGYIEKDNNSYHTLGYMEQGSVYNVLLLAGQIKAVQYARLHNAEVVLDPQATKLIQSLAHSYDQKVEMVESSEDISAWSEMLVKRMTPEQLKRHKSWLDSLQSESTQPTRKDRFTLEEMKIFLQEHATHAEPVLQERLELEHQWKRLLEEQAHNRNQELFDPITHLEQLSLTPEMVKKFTQPFARQVSKLRERFLEVMPEAWQRKLLVSVSAAGIYFGYPYIYENFIGASDFTALTWMYEHLYRDVLQDANTRTQTIAAMLIGISFTAIPFVLTSTTAKIISAWNKAINNKQSRFSRMLNCIGELIERSHPFFHHADPFGWGLGTIVSFSGQSLQATHTNIMDAWRRQARSLDRDWGLHKPKQWKKWKSEQRHSFYFEQLSRRLISGTIRMSVIFAFPLIKAALLSGRWLGKKSLRLFLSPEEQKKYGEALHLAHNELQAEQQKRIDLATKLALLAVGEHTQINSGVLLMAKSIPLSELASILDDPKKLNDVRLLQSEILSSLSQTPIDELIKALEENPQEFKQAVESAQITAKLLQTSTTFRLQSQLQRTLQLAKLQARLKLAAFSNLGGADIDLFRKIKPDQINPVTLRQIVSEFINDNLMIAVFTSLVGPFADPKKPDHLFGQWVELPKSIGAGTIPLEGVWKNFDVHSFPFLSEQATLIMSKNTISHLFLTAPVTLSAFGAIDQRRHNPYTPRPELEHPHIKRYENPIHTILNNLFYVFHFTQSNFGGEYLKYMQRFWSNYQPRAIANISLRMGILGWSFYPALLGFFADELLCFVFYRPLWNSLRITNRHNNQRLNDKVDLIQRLTTQLGQGLSNIKQAQTEEEQQRAYAHLRAAQLEVLNTYLEFDPATLKKLHRSLKSILPSSNDETDIRDLMPKRFSEMLPLFGQTSQYLVELTRLQKMQEISTLSYAKWYLKTHENHQVLQEATDSLSQSDELGRVIRARENEIEEQIKRVEELRLQLLRALQEQGLPHTLQENLIRESEGLINLLQTHPPVATDLHDQYVNAANLSVAITTTIIATYITFMSTGPKLMNDPSLAWSYIAMGVAYIPVQWALTSATAWNYYVTKAQIVKSKLKHFASVISTKKKNERQCDKMLD